MEEKHLERNQSSSHFRPGTAARHMLTKIPTAYLDETVGLVRQRIIKKKNWDSINYIYLLDKKDRLTGVISIKELFRTNARKKLKDFKNSKLVVTHPHSSLQIVTAKVIAHNVKALPVIDTDRALMGVIGNDTIINTLEQEHVRDLLTASGLPAGKSTFTDVLTAKISQLVKWRTPWLAVGVIGGALTSSIVGGFESNLEQVIELTFYIPMMLYMGAAVGNQTQMLFVRGISYQQIKLGRYLWHELVVDSLIGIILATLLGIFALITTSSQLFAAIVATSVFAIVATAGLVAIIISEIFILLKKDPAMGGGPFATIVQDVFSLIFYLSIASFFLKFL
ncbi:magnesium transporter [Patescibacteria group bacterium]